MTPKSSLLAFLSILSLSLAAGCAAETNDDPNGDEEDLKSSKAAGGYTDFGKNAHRNTGDIYELDLELDHTFTMTLQGLFGCSYDGYDCPSTWSDGTLGWTSVVGTWKDTPNGVRLQPHSNKSKKANPVDLTMSVSGETLTTNGTIGGHQVQGILDVEGIYSKAHKATEADLDGTWTDTTKPDSNGNNFYLNGGALPLSKGEKHVLTFDSKKHLFSEGIEGAKSTGSVHFAVAGNGTGSGEGRILWRDEFITGDEIVSVSAHQLVIVAVGGHKMTLVK